MLNKTFLKKIKDTLIKEKKLLFNKNYSISDIDMDGDETDEIQGTMLVELNSQIQCRDAQKLHQIDDALNRIQNKTYGMCEDCEESIPEKRLLFNPYLLTCVSCAELREIQNKQRKRL